MDDTHRHCGQCGETVPFDAMCACDQQAWDKLKSKQIDNHPEPGGHHAYVGNPPTCACGLVYGSDDYLQRLDIAGALPLYRRDPLDLVVATMLAYEAASHAAAT
ncbi:hypothetical protein P3H15_27295 [Rhodococcus sp. T2V]|uniref:hypothetical protein n=1 Tax=Rhodococcus sp. T2V TaxID=3034164 RepID=UPI0023E1F86A|nr:hypothetical protein [Rhodococcus sp. T2V]MDF3308728.1 hypothetical protein [Rhodococcus sp. T2V]